MIDNKRLIELALRGLELERQRIQDEIDSLRRQFGGNRPAAKPGPKSSSRPKSSRGGRLTPEGRRKLSESMKARWAARRAAVAVKKSRR